MASRKHRQTAERLARGPHKPAAIVRSVEQLEGKPPAPSTIYRWIAEARARQSRDGSGPWLLARDDSGRPDLVLRVQVAHDEEWAIAEHVLGQGARSTAERIAAAPTPQLLTNAEARLLGVLGGVLPDPGIDRDALLDLLDLARRYVAAGADEVARNDDGARADQRELMLLDAEVGALMFMARMEGE